MQHQQQQVAVRVGAVRVQSRNSGTTTKKERKPTVLRVAAKCTHGNDVETVYHILENLSHKLMRQSELAITQLVGEDTSCYSQ